MNTSNMENSCNYLNFPKLNVLEDDGNWAKIHRLPLTPMQEHQKLMEGRKNKSHFSTQDLQDDNDENSSSRAELVAKIRKVMEENKVYNSSQNLNIINFKKSNVLKDDGNWAKIHRSQERQKLMEGRKKKSHFSTQDLQDDNAENSSSRAELVKKIPKVVEEKKVYNSSQN